MKVLVTGGSGKVGKYIVADLLRDHEVGVLDLRNPVGAHTSYHRADVLSLSSLTRAIEGYDAVIHLAGIPHPLDLPGEKVFQVNTIGTFNALEASALSGVGTFVFMSSDSTLGFAFAKNPMSPVSVPVDEDHPLRPQDPYGLSKVAGELLCAAYARTYGMQTISLRAPWIWVPEATEVEFYKSLVREYDRWQNNLWAYIHAYDVCGAVRKALTAPPLGEHGTFFIAATDQWTDRPTRELLKRFYPDVIVPDDSYEGRESLLSSARAGEVLGFRAAFSKDDLFG